MKLLFCHFTREVVFCLNVLVGTNRFCVTRMVFTVKMFMFLSILRGCWMWRRMMTRRRPLHTAGPSWLPAPSPGAW